jgi:hypothetical protein
MHLFFNNDKNYVNIISVVTLYLYSPCPQKQTKKSGYSLFLVNLPLTYVYSNIQGKLIENLLLTRC